MNIDARFKNQNLYDVATYGEVEGYDVMVCPYCGVEFEYTFDDIEYAPYENMETVCPECEKEFLIDCSPVAKYDFTSRRKNK